MRKFNFLTLAVPVVVFAVYLFTLYPTVGWVDCGELATGCSMLNVLHPTGYPLYTLIGFLFAHLPIGSVVTRVNALSALCSAVAAMFCFLTVCRLSRSQVAGLVTAALCAFSFTVWSNSVDADVFGLTALYVSLTIYLLVRLRDSPMLLFIPYLLGLALTNHMSFMSTFAGAVLYLLLVYRREVLRLRTLLPLAALFLLALTPYAYLLIRSQAKPLFNWGNPHNLQRLIWHMTGKQFQVWMFSSPPAEIMRNLGRALGTLARELYFVLIPVFLWGAWLLLRKSREVFWLLAVVFALNVFYAVNYSIPDIESYYIPFMTAAFITTGVGLADLIKRLKRVPSYAFLLLALLPPAVNLNRAGAQGDYVAGDLARNYMKSAPQGAIVMTTNWDVYSPVFYFRHIEHLRPDLCIIDKELLRRSWYFQSLEQEYPWLVERSRQEIDRYLCYLDQFEHNTLQDNAAIQQAYIAVISSFITRNPERQALWTFDNRADKDAAQVLPDRARVPYGLFYELKTTPSADSFDYTQFTIRYRPSQLDARTKGNLANYQRMAVEHAFLLARGGRKNEAIADLNWVLEKFPGTKPAADLLARIQAGP